MLKKIVFFALAIAALTSCKNEEKSQLVQCHGNVETFAKEVIKTGVEYKLRYSIKDTKAQVYFAGREFLADAEKGKTYKGYWIKKISDNIYFSFMPDEGGIIKYQLEPNVWFSGNC